MGKKRKRRIRRHGAYTGKNRHHLLFQRRHWDKGPERILHKKFVYMLDVKIHDELHNAIIKDIPKPSSKAILSILEAFQAQRQEISQMNIVEASEWLQNACDEEPYHTTMKLQTLFLRERLGK